GDTPSRLVSLGDVDASLLGRQPVRHDVAEQLRRTAFFALEDPLQFAALLGRGAVVDVKAPGAIAVEQCRAGKIHAQNDGACAEIYFVRAATFDQVPLLRVAPAAIHDHQLFD